MKPEYERALELIKTESISYLDNARNQRKRLQKLIFPLAIIFKSGIKNIEIAVVYESTYKC